MKILHILKQLLHILKLGAQNRPNISAALAQKKEQNKLLLHSLSQAHDTPESV